MSISKILIVILIIVAIAVAAVFIMGRFDQTKPIYDLIMDKVQPIKEFVSNPTGAVTATLLNPKRSRRLQSNVTSLPYL